MRRPGSQCHRTFTLTVSEDSLKVPFQRNPYIWQSCAEDESDSKYSPLLALLSDLETDSSVSLWPLPTQLSN